jgi:hypothetical protein
MKKSGALMARSFRSLDVGTIDAGPIAANRDDRVALGGAKAERPGINWHS